MKYKLLVFDWDGTIIDSASTIADCIRLAAGDLGLDVPTKEQASHVIGLGLQDALRYAVPQLRPEQLSEFVARYRYHFLMREDTMGLFDGIRDLIESMSKVRTLAIATGKSRRGLDRALEATGLSPFFQASRCADETNPKPHPAMLLELMGEFDVAPDSALMIGDTSHDLDMAKAAGVDALAVTYGAHPAESLRACAPKGCVGSVKELDQWLSANT